MRHVRALFALLIVWALLISGTSIGAGLGSAVGGQDAGAGSGDAVPVSDEEGAAVGSITVTEVADPFTEFDPAYPPEEGGRYVAVNVAFDADAGARFDIAPYTIVLQDDAGFLWNQASMVLADDALIPELSSQTLGPGSRVTGVIGFVVPEGREPARILYQPESSRVIPLLELSGYEPPLLGDAVSIADSDGGSGAVTVSEIVDPFEDLDPTQTPPEDGRFVLVTLVYENLSAGRFSVEPHGLLLRDENGNLWSSTSISRLEETEIVPDLTSADLAPGDRLSGAIAFAIPGDTGLAGIYASPLSGQLVQLASLQEDVDSGSSTAGEETDEASEGATTDEPAEFVSAALSDDACEVLDWWLSGARERIRIASEMSLEAASLEDLDSLTDYADAYAELAEEQLADVAPPEADAAGKALVATLRAYSDALEQILGANDPGNDVTLELVEGMNAFNEAGVRIGEIEEEFARIAAACE